MNGEGGSPNENFSRYDGSNAAKDALKLAQKHAKTFNAEINVITSFTQKREVTEKDIDEMARADRLLEEIKLSLQEEQIPCVTFLSVNDLTPGEGVVLYANENQIDEIIVGVRRRSKVGKLIFGSTAQYVILNAPCPVLTIK